MLADRQPDHPFFNWSERKKLDETKNGQTAKMKESSGNWTSEEI
ncbi:MAG: hypothetical protein ACK521_05525 [bacterium]|jgi:hypothetical protein